MACCSADPDSTSIYLIKHGLVKYKNLNSYLELSFNRASHLSSISDVLVFSVQPIAALFTHSSCQQNFQRKQLVLSLQ